LYMSARQPLESNRRQSCETKAASADPNHLEHSKLRHESCVWNFALCLDESHARPFTCVECGGLPKFTHAFVCERGNIFCEYCIDILIESQSPCKVNGEVISSKSSGLVVDNLTKSIMVRCPNSEPSEVQRLQDHESDDHNSGNMSFGWNQSRQSSISQHELKMEQIEDDDSNIALPPRFPTNAEQFQYNEGVDENQIAAQGIMGRLHDLNERQQMDAEARTVCSWRGKLEDLPDHLQSECKHRRLDCPLHGLDGLCDVRDLHQDRLRRHLEENAVSHWQMLVDQVNELKSVQLSIKLKLEAVTSHSPKSPPMEPVAAGNRGEPIPSITPRDEFSELLGDQSREFQNEIRKLWADSMAYRDRTDRMIETLRQKDRMLATLSSKMNAMQREMDSLKKDKESEWSMRSKYESGITSILSQSSVGQSKMLELQSRMESFSSELKAKDNVIESQNKSISALQSTIAEMNLSAANRHTPQYPPQPGCPGMVNQFASSTPQFPPHHVPGVVTPGGPPIQPLYAPHPTLSRPHHHGPPGRISSPPPPSPMFDRTASSSDPASRHQSHSPRRKRIRSRRQAAMPKLQHSASEQQQSVQDRLLLRRTDKYRRSSCPDYREERDIDEFPLRGDGGSQSMGVLMQRQESQESYRSDSGGSPTTRHSLDDDAFANVPSLAFSSSSAARSMPVSHRKMLTKSRRSQHFEDRHSRDRRRYPVALNKSSHSSSSRGDKDDRRKRRPKQTTRPKMTIYAFGCNENGEIGLGHNKNLSEVTKLPFCDTLGIVDMFYGSQSFFYLTHDHELYCSGYNKYGQLGLGHNTEYIIKPTLNKYFSSENRQIERVSNSVCSYSTIVMTNDGQLYGFGSNDHCQLGIGKKSFQEKVPVLLTAGVLSLYENPVEDLNVVAVSCGFHHTLFLTDRGRVICCGSNKFGQLGYGNNVNQMTAPEFVDEKWLKNIVQIACGEYFSVALNRMGSVFTFGQNTSGQLGLGDTLVNEEAVFTPTHVRWFQTNGIMVEKVQCGDKHVLSLDSEGKAFAWGSNEYGQVGCDGKTHCSMNVNIPSQCRLPDNNRSKKVMDIECGVHHSLLLSTDFEIYTMGNNDCNQVSLAQSHKKISKPYWLRSTEIKSIREGAKITQIIAGFDCSFLITNETQVAL